MASLQQVIEQLALLAAAGANATIDGNVTSAAQLPEAHGPFELVASLTKVLLSAKALRDWAIILAIGSFFETGRRLLSGWWTWLINSFFITAVFDDTDPSFQWILWWLSKQPSWKGARNIQISTANFGLNSPAVDILETRDDPTGNMKKVSYLPAISETYTVWYKYHWMNVTRSIETQRGGWSSREYVTLSIMTRDHRVLADILRQAMTGYHKAQEDSITIYSGRTGGDGWREIATRPKRSLHSIILDPGITDLVVGDARDFLESKQWYADRGIPFRRGYLLHGTPGAGKTSLIHSIAGELSLDVYIVSLSRSGLDDTGLIELISELPERCIALMEDIDAVFHHGITREFTSKPADTDNSDDADEEKSSGGPPPSPSNRVSLSGLLNALDGIAAQEGRILFATTNKYSSLDPALCRPGRLDLHIEFKHASRYQARELFGRFYTPTSSELAEDAKMATTKKNKGTSGKSESASASGESGPEDSPAQNLIDLSSESSLPPSSSASGVSEKTDVNGDATIPAPTFTGVSHRIRPPRLSTDEINKLAAQFSASVPERRISMASLQGYLMTYKTRPYEAVEKVSAWVEEELKEKE